MCFQINVIFQGEEKIVRVNDKYERLTILDIFKKDGRWCAKCECDCGKIVEKIVIRSLLSGNTKSCGCYSSDCTIQRNLRHGDGHRGNKARLYTIWVDMHRRCENANRPRATNYCLKGIRVCDEWTEYLPFKEWAMANGYDDSLTLERIDNDKNYCPENCKWIPKSEQSKNRTTNHYITYNGKTQTLTDWAKELGINRTTIHARLNRGWSIDKALSTDIN